MFTNSFTMGRQPSPTMSKRQPSPNRTSRGVSSLSKLEPNPQVVYSGSGSTTIQTAAYISQRKTPTPSKITRNNSEQPSRIIRNSSEPRISLNNAESSENSSLSHLLNVRPNNPIRNT